MGCLHMIGTDAAVKDQPYMTRATLRNVSIAIAVAGEMAGSKDYGSMLSLHQPRGRLPAQQLAEDHNPSCVMLTTHQTSNRQYAPSNIPGQTLLYALD